MQLIEFQGWEVALTSKESYGDNVPPLFLASLTREPTKNPALACGASLGLWAILDYLASLGGRTGGGFYNPSEALRTVVRLVCLGSLRSSKLDARANKKPRT